MTAPRLVIDNDVEAFKKARRAAQAHLPSGGGGDNFDGMEARVAKLESDVSHLVADMAEVKGDVKDATKTLADVRVSLATIDTKVGHLPGKGFVVTVVATSLALLTTVLIFLEKLQHLVAGIH